MINLNENNKELIRDLYLEHRSFRKVSNLIPGVSKDAANLCMNTFFPELVERKHSIGTPDYFEKIDTVNKAYLLGFIAADGYLNQPENNRYLEVCLNEKDVSVLELLKSELRASHPISYKPQVNARRLHIGSPKLVADIEKYEIYNNKSLTMGNVLRNIPDEFKGNFICGLWDGDGSCGVYDYRYKFLVASILGTKECINGIRDFLDIEGYLRRDKRHHENTLTWSIRKKSDLISLYKQTYLKTPCSLKRKHDKFLEMGYIQEFIKN